MAVLRCEINGLVVGWLIGWLIAWLVDCLVGAAETAAPPMRAAYGILSGGVRNLIGRRTESDRAPNAIRSGGGRTTMTILKQKSNFS